MVKSPPELWSECSDAGSLARHLGEFGEITITRLDPETTVAWEGEHASGTVRIEPSGWGTRVTLTAQTKAEISKEAPAEPEATEAIQAAPAGAEIQTREEEADATLEATLEDPDPVPVVDTGRARARWRRMTARMRGVFGGGGGPDDPVAEETAPEPPAEAQVVASDLPPEGVESDAEVAAEIELQSDSGPPFQNPLEGQAATGPKLDTESVLASALDSLGQAHHRPFSRA